MWVGCGLDQTPMLLDGDELACVGSIWSKCSMRFTFLNPKRPKFVTWGRKVIFSFRPQISNCVAIESQNGPNKLHLLTCRASSKQHTCIINICKCDSLSVTCIYWLSEHFSHNQQVLCNRVGVALTTARYVCRSGTDSPRQQSPVLIFR